MAQQTNSADNDQSNPGGSPAWSLLLDIGGSTKARKHERLIQELRSAIRSGRIPAGATLPPSRALAADLGCSRWVVTEAYAQLTAEGYLHGRAGSATRVRWVGETVPRPGPRAVRAAAPPRLDLAPGLPDLRAFPRHRWVEGIRRAGNQAGFETLGIADQYGRPELREVVAAYLRRVRGAVADAQDVAITAGTTDGASLVAQALAHTGHGRIAVEDPGWTRLRRAVGFAGLTPVSVPVDHQGIVVDAIPRGVRAVLVAPAHQFPTGVLLSPARRARLLAWARDVDGVVIEDDYDAEFRYDGRPVGVLQGGDARRVVLLGSVSKTLAPGLGLGWAVVPRRLTQVHAGIERRPALPPALDQLGLADFITSGAYDRHLRAVRRGYRTRRDLLLRALEREVPECTVTGIAAGLHLVLGLPPVVDVGAVVRRAAAADVRVADLAAYGVRATLPPALVLGYGNLADPRVGEAVARLAAAVRSSP